VERRVQARVNAELGGSPKLNKQTVRFRGDAQEMDFDVERSRRINVQRASWALRDSRHVNVKLGDSDAAEEWQRLLGLTETPEVGARVRLDGHWNEAVKARVLGEHAELAMWVVGKAAEQRAHAQEIEGALSKT
jgi:hypothetical protein